MDESPIEATIVDGALLSLACAIGSAFFFISLQCFVIGVAAVVVLVQSPPRALNHREPPATKRERPVTIADAGVEAIDAQKDTSARKVAEESVAGVDAGEVEGEGEGDGASDDGIFCATNDAPGEVEIDEQCEDDASTKDSADIATENGANDPDSEPGSDTNGGDNDAITSCVEDEGDHRERHADAIAKIIAKKRAKELAHEIRRQKLSSETLTIKLILCNYPDHSQKISTLTIPKTTTPALLRKAISQATKIPDAEIRVLFRGRSISPQRDGWVCFQFGIKDGSVLHVLGRPRQPNPCDGERAALIQEQDLEYQESLQKDQERARKLELEKGLRQRRQEEMGEAKRRLLDAGVQSSLLSNNDELNDTELNCRVRLHLPSGQKVEGTFARRHRMGLVYDLALLALAKERLLWNQQDDATVDSADVDDDSGSVVLRNWGGLHGLCIPALWRKLFHPFSLVGCNQKAFDGRRTCFVTLERSGLSHGATLFVVVESD